MDRLKTVSRVILAIALLIIGTMHFIYPSELEKVLPEYLPYHFLLVYLGGTLEILSVCICVYLVFHLWLIIQNFTHVINNHKFLLTNQSVKISSHPSPLPPTSFQNVIVNTLINLLNHQKSSFNNYKYLPQVNGSDFLPNVG